MRDVVLLSEGIAPACVRGNNDPQVLRVDDGTSADLEEGGDGNAGAIGPDDARFGASGVLTSRFQRSLCGSGGYSRSYGNIPEDWTGKGLRRNAIHDTRGGRDQGLAKTS
jgi:hypothetical protein